MMEVIVNIFGRIYDYIGFIPSVLIIGLSPIYFLLYLYSYKKFIVLHSPVGALCIIISVLLSIFMIAIFFMVYAYSRMWG